MIRDAVASKDPVQRHRFDQHGSELDRAGSNLRLVQGAGRLIHGGGYIDLEVACMFRSLGSGVIGIEGRPELVAGLDHDFVSLAARCHPNRSCTAKAADIQ